MQKIQLKDITRPENPSRTQIDEKGIVELANSMRGVGLLNPIHVRKKDAGYEIEAGERRFLAAEYLCWDSIPAFILQETDEDGIHLERAHENLIRVDLNPVEEAKIVYNIVYQDGRGVEATSKLLCKKGSWIEDRMDILKWPKDIISALEHKQVSIAVGKELSKVGNPDGRQRLLTSAIEFAAPARVVKQWVSDWETEEYLKDKSHIKTREEIASIDRGESKLECRVCGFYFVITHMRHIWLCPDCLMGVRTLADVTRAEIAKDEEEGEDKHENNDHEHIHKTGQD